MTALDDWADSVTAALGITALAAADRDRVLDLARDVAHGVMRPAAPLTSYLLGVAVGRGADPETVAAMIAQMASTWPEADSETRPA